MPIPRVSRAEMQGRMCPKRLMALQAYLKQDFRIESCSQGSTVSWPFLWVHSTETKLGKAGCSATQSGMRVAKGLCDLTRRLQNKGEWSDIPGGVRMIAHW